MKRFANVFSLIGAMSLALSACGRATPDAARATGLDAPPDFEGRDLGIPLLDLNTATFSMPVRGAGLVGGVSLTVNLSHTYVGDLIISLAEPGGAKVVLQSRSGGNARRVDQTYGGGGVEVDFGPLIHREIEGMWKLIIEDKEADDAGTLEAVRLSITKV